MIFICSVACVRLSSVAAVGGLLNKLGGLTFSNAFRLMHLLEFFLLRIFVICPYSWIRLVSLSFEGEMDVDGPDLLFVCFAMHGTPVERESACQQLVCV